MMLVSSVAPWRTTSAASFTSKSDRSSPPAIESPGQPAVRTDDDGVARRAHFLAPVTRGRSPLRALEADRQRHDPDRQRAQLARDPPDHGRRPRAGAPPSPAVTKIMSEPRS